MAVPDATSWVHIDLRKLEANCKAIAALRDPAAPAMFCAVVKADAYGLGQAAITQRLARCGVDMLAVYSPQQAREAIPYWNGPLLIMGMIDKLPRVDVLYRPLITGRLHLTIHCLEQLHAVDDIGRTFGAMIPVHLFLDTGMSRSGMDDAHFDRAIAHALQSRYVRLAGISSHFAAADDDADFTDHQFSRLEAALDRHATNLPNDCIVHTANTFATFRDARYHRSMLRVGLSMYGFGGPDLQPIARWQSRVIHMRSFPKGADVGYNRTATLERDSILGVVPVGYGDGYALALGNRAMVELPQLDAHAPVVGKVNMDQITIDLTDIAGAQVGSLVNVYSDDPKSPASVANLADIAGEHCYAMLTRISARIGREYIR